MKETSSRKKYNEEIVFICKITGNNTLKKSRVGFIQEKVADALEYYVSQNRWPMRRECEFFWAFCNAFKRHRNKENKKSVKRTVFLLNIQIEL